MADGLQSVAVWSPKGGVGKSVLAVALALKLSETRRTVIIDGNPDNPDVVNLLQCSGYPNVTGWEEPADSTRLESLMVRHSNRLWVMPGPPRYVEAEAMRGPVMESILDACLRAKMAVVVDLGSTLRDSTVAALDKVDRVLVPVTLDLLSLAPLRRLGGELSLMRLPEAKFRVVINRHTGTREVTVEDIHDFSFRVDAVVPSSKELAAAVNRGEVGTILSGKSAVGSALAQLAESFAGDESAAQQELPQRRGLIGSLLRPQRKGAL